MATPLIKWQRPMKRVLYALTPIVISSIYFFGCRALLLLTACNLAAFLTEYTFARTYKESVTSAVFVTGTLFALSLPPTLPLWMAVLGAIFGITFGKMVFGGFGKNIFNPALTGRAFIYVSFGAHMTAMWGEPINGLLGGFAAYAPDAITQATPGMLLKTNAHFPILELFLGRTSGTLGGTSALLAILGGLTLIRTKAANYRIVLSGFIGFFSIHTLLWLLGTDNAADPLRACLAGNLIFGMFFYATDPVSGPKTNEARWIYGAFIGVMSSLISTFSAWPAGTMFAILLANMFAPITDHAVKEWKKRKHKDATT